MTPMQLQLFAATLIIPFFALAVPVEIIYTSDLHSVFIHPENPRVGGYAQIKSGIDQIKEQHPGYHLVLNAGDFTEGSLYYLANRGQTSFALLNMLGFDAVTIGNHDWLMGLPEMNHTIEFVPPAFAFLGANFKTVDVYPNVLQTIKPYAEYSYGNAKVAVLGLTTNNRIFSWRNLGATIDPLPVAETYIKSLRQENDFIVVLSHMGLEADEEFIKKTSGIDLVIGGHTHLILDKPKFIKNAKGADIPLMIVARHGEAIGHATIGFDPGKPANIIAHNILRVENLPPDKEVTKAIEQTIADIEQDYGKEWLYESIGRTEIPLNTSPTERTMWGDFVAVALKEATKSDIAVTVPQFSGLGQPQGTLTRAQVFMLFPRMLDFDDKYGWNIWQSEIIGLTVKTAIEEAINRNAILNVAGVKFEVEESKGRKKIKNLMIAGKPYSAMKWYKAAFPEGLPKGALEISSVFKLIFQNAVNTKMPVWTTLADRIRKLRVITKEEARRLHAETQFINGHQTRSQQ